MKTRRSGGKIRHLNGSLGIRMVELKLTTDPAETQDKLHGLARKKVKNL